MTTMTFPESDAHYALWQAEAAACEPTAWEHWIARVESLLGHDADGDLAEDGYALDAFYDDWQSGMTPEQSVAQTFARVKR